MKIPFSLYHFLTVHHWQLKGQILQPKSSLSLAMWSSLALYPSLSPPFTCAPVPPHWCVCLLPVHQHWQNLWMFVVCSLIVISVIVFTMTLPQNPLPLLPGLGTSPGCSLNVVHLISSNSLYVTAFLETECLWMLAWYWWHNIVCFNKHSTSACMSSQTFIEFQL